MFILLSSSVLLGRCLIRVMLLCSVCCVCLMDMVGFVFVLVVLVVMCKLMVFWVSGVFML